VCTLPCMHLFACTETTAQTAILQVDGALDRWINDVYTACMPSFGRRPCPHGDIESMHRNGSRTRPKRLAAFCDAHIYTYVRNGRDACLHAFTPKVSNHVCALRSASMGFIMHTKYSATSAKFHFLHETFRREKESVSPW
jgi:hypothetical protein